MSQYKEVQMNPIPLQESSSFVAPWGLTHSPLMNECKGFYSLVCCLGKLSLLYFGFDNTVTRYNFRWRKEYNLLFREEDKRGYPEVVTHPEGTSFLLRSKACTLHLNNKGEVLRIFRFKSPKSIPLEFLPTGELYVFAPELEESEIHPEDKKVSDLPIVTSELVCPRYDVYSYHTPIYSRFLSSDSRYLYVQVDTKLISNRIIDLHTGSSCPIRTQEDIDLHFLDHRDGKFYFLSIKYLSLISYDPHSERSEVGVLKFLKSPDFAVQDKYLKIYHDLLKCLDKYFQEDMEEFYLILKRIIYPYDGFFQVRSQDKSHLAFCFPPSRKIFLFDLHTEDSYVIDCKVPIRHQSVFLNYHSLKVYNPEEEGEEGNVHVYNLPSQWRHDNFHQFTPEIQNWYLFLIWILQDHFPVELIEHILEF